MNFSKREIKSFGDKILTMDGFSKKAVKEHLKLYQGYVSKYNEITEKLSGLTDEDLAKANQTYSLVRELKVELTFAWGGLVNHEIYFSHLGGPGGNPDGDLIDQIKKDFGSLESFKKEMKATGISARGWVWTAWNHEEKRLFNYLGDAQNSFPVWGATPILALDTYEHAYFMDYGANRGGYIDAFFANLDWKVVSANFAKIGKK
ncbi:superoxide dismutase [Candidatus Roizmanbacteria bacterium]|nr:superoxide dismutase [Candidatus Roizmanbacteria bacterium]